jgi:class 3 adenylate cyclase
VLIPEFGFTNIYGTDVTAMKALNRFPDRNPNPVLRVSRDGRLQYANPASALVLNALGVGVGDPLPADFFGRVRSSIAAESADVLEVRSAGRIFELLVVSLFEFESINLYGTDVTAAREVEQANRENERLLLNILPRSIAQRLRQGEMVIADRFEEMTVLFADVVGFTELSMRLSPSQLVDMLNRVFSAFDRLADKYGLEKIETIGDAYMVVGGLTPGSLDHAERVADMGVEMIAEVARLRDSSDRGLEIRVGLHTGPAVAGVIGIKKFIYDVWGDTVNTASRMESHGVPGRIQVTGAAYERLRSAYAFESRGMIEVKGRGPTATYLLVGRRSVAVPETRPQVRPGA